MSIFLLINFRLHLYYVRKIIPHNDQIWRFFYADLPPDNVRLLTNLTFSDIESFLSANYCNFAV